MPQKKSAQAFAASNLLDLGVAPRDCAPLARDWARRSAERSGSRIAEKVHKYDLHVPDAAGSLFLSFHYSDYGVIYPALGAATQTPVYAIIGAQDADHAQALSLLAAGQGCDLRFIESGLSMVKRARRVMAEGSAVLLLIDVPWTQNGVPTDTSYPCGPGAMNAHASLARLVSLLCDVPRGLVPQPDLSPGRLNVFDCPDLSIAYARFGKMLQKHPVDYERLDKMHRYYRPERSASSVICFVAGENEFAIHARSGGAWRLNRGVVDAVSKAGDPSNSSWREAFAGMVGSEVDVVLAV